MEFDVLIKNGTVIDGSGTPGRAADVAIVGDRIEVVDRLEGAIAGEVVDATGKVVAPGFIDVHVHSEVALADPRNPYRYGSVLQGVTTQLAAPNGFGWAPLSPERARELWDCTLFSHREADLPLNWPTVESFLAIFERKTPANVFPQAPHCAIRLGVMGWEARPATADEIERMKPAPWEWMEAGATCLCLGLDYQPSAFADTRELVELSKVAAEYDGIYAAHIRYNDAGREAAWRETMAIGRQAKIPVHVSHEHVTDLTEPLLEEAERARDLTFESYLYPAGCTHLALMLPSWGSAGGPAAIRERLNDPATRRALRDHLHHKLAVERGNARAIFVGTRTGRYIGEDLTDVAAREGLPVGDFALQVLEEEHPYALMVYHHGTTPEYQADSIRRTARHPKMMVASDGMYHGQSAHPRGYGCFARVLRLCAREMGAISLENAVWKMSGFPAERFRIPERGFLQPGYGADIVIFDPVTVADQATWDEPRLEPVGIDRVIVNGQTVVLDGRPTGELPGRVVRRQA
ncbi:MAG: N-acyl-D-amino-acid deacylase family protein [Thermomicrobiales bacterium]